MPTIVAQWYEAGNWHVAFRLWRLDGTAVEPEVTVPMQTWLALDDAGRTVMLEAGVTFSRLHHPHLSEEEPRGTNRADGRADARANADGPGDNGTDADVGPGESGRAGRGRPTA